MIYIYPKLLFIAFFCSFIPTLAIAQNSREIILDIAIVDSLKTPIEYAAVSIYSLPDSTLIKNNISGKNGWLQIADVKPGLYLVAVSHLVYEKATENLHVSQTNRSFTIQLSEKKYVLDDIVIEASFIERRADRYKMAIAANPVMQGKTALEALGQLPGVSTNKGITVNGVTGTQIYINNRKVRDLKELNALSSSLMDNVEVIYKAGSAYDAQNRGGIINISLKKYLPVEVMVLLTEGFRFVQNMVLEPIP